MKTFTFCMRRVHGGLRSLIFFTILSLLFAGMLLFNGTASAQPACATPTNNNGNGKVTFNFRNNNTYDVIITDISSVIGSGGSGISVATEAWWRPGALSFGSASAFPALNSTNWTQFGSATITGVANTTTTTPQSFFNGSLSLLVPAGQTIGVAINAANAATPTTGVLRYSSLTAGQSYVYSSGGCDILSGGATTANASAAGVARLSSATFANAPRGFIGCVTFMQAAPCSGTPDPGVAVSSTATACPGANFTLSATGLSTGMGLTYQWEYSTNGGQTWTVLSGAASSSTSLSHSVPTDYRLVTTCSNSGLSNYSSVVSVGVDPGGCTSGCYSLSGIASSTLDEDISNVTIGGFSNSSTCASTGTGPGSLLNRYSNYTDLGNGPNEGQGAVVNFSLTMTSCGTSPYGHFFQIYVDWNQDGDWLDADEQVYSEPASVTATTRTLTGSFVVPVAAPQGNTRMRVVVIETTASTVNYAHTGYSWGETEDYCFTVGPPPACVAPQALNVTGITSSSANINFTGSSTAAYYEVVVQAPGSGAPTGTGNIVTANTFPATGLSPNTPYEAYARAICGSSSSVWVGPINFRTTCVTASMPYLMDFNLWPPDCWDLTGGTFSATQGNNSTGTPDHLRANFWSQQSGQFALATSVPINISADARARFNWSHQYNTTYPNDQVLLLGQIVGSTTWDTLVNLFGPNFNTVGSGTTTPSPTANFALETAILPLTYTGQDVIFQFRLNSGFGQDVFIDNFRVEAIPQCAEPAGFVSSNIGPFDAQFDWTAISSALSYEIVIQPAGSGLPTGTGVAAATNTYSATGLSAQTNYEAYVRSVCASGLLSPWTGPLAFTTACAWEVAPTVPQTFATWTGTPLPLCWEKASGALGATVTLTPNSGNWFSSANFGNGSGTNRAAKVNLWSTQNSWLISQAIDLGSVPGAYRLKYNMAVTDYLGTLPQTTLGTHVVDVVVSTDAGATWSNANIIRTYTGAGNYSNTGQIEFVNLGNYSGIIKVAFVATTSSSTPDIDFHIDDVSVEAIPQCPYPNALNAAPASASSANLNWTAGGTETEWEAAVVLAGSPVPTSGTSVLSTNFTATGLTLDSTYTAYVRSICNPTTISPWTTVNFTMNYCASAATSTFDTRIASVSVNGVTVTSPVGPGNCASYTDYTALPPFQINSGASFPVAVQHGTCDGSYNAYAKVYIDANNDLAFDPITEMVAEGAVPAATTLSVTGNLPIGTFSGITRLRVVLVETTVGTSVQPCGSYTWGETQDFSVNILAPQPNDLGVVAVLSPNSGCGLGSSETVTVRITNFGTATQSNFPVSYSVNGGAAVTEIFNGSIDFGMSANHTFAATANMSTSGAYSIKGFSGLTGDATASNDTTVRVVNNIPVISGATLPYNENFENGAGGWVVGGTTTFALGAPAGIAITSAAPGGNNSWVTNLNGNYNDNENGYIESPCFDFTGVYGAEVSFDLWWNMENNFDKGVFYYSTDAGATWSILGTLGSGQNWYNLTTTFGPIPGSPVWTGSTLSGVSSNGWVRAVHHLNVVDNLPSVKFRIAFLSDGSVNGYDGLGFDNFRVRVPVDPIITFVTRATDSCALATRLIEAKVRHFAALTDVNLHHDMMGVGTYSATPMVYTAADSTWRATLPAGASAVMKRYFVSAQDAINLTDTSDIVRFMDDPIVISAGNDTTIAAGSSAVLRASSVQGPSGILGDLTQSASTSCGGGFMFDITAPSAGVSITGFDVLPFNAGSQVVNVYYKAGSKDGFQTNQAAWTLEGSYTINPAAGGTATFMAINGISIPPSGTVAIYLQYYNYYSSSGINFSNADLTILNGEGLCTNWQTCCTPRYWRGRIHYGSNLSLIWTDATGAQLGTTDTLLVTPNSTTAYVLTATNGVCVKSDTVLVSIAGSIQPPVSGTLRYDNTALTPMTNTTVSLLSGGVQVTSVITNASGDFNFGPVPPGAYTLQYQTNKPWGGVNSVDALNITRHFSVVQPLSGLRLRVADVNNSNSVSATDALQVNQRFSFLRAAFSSGDWAYSLTTLTVPNDPTPIVLSGRALCFGDVNGSYNPNVNLRERWEDLTQSGEVFTGEGEYTVNLQLESALNVGAVSLVLRVPAGMEVLGITTGLGSSDEVVFKQIGNVVRIAWHTLQQWDVENGGVLLRIRARGMADGGFALGAHESELANSWADVYGTFGLRSPRLVGSSANYTGVSVYPNPSASIFRVSSETAMQELVVRDMSGREVLRSLPVAGATELDLSAQRDGVYMLEVRLSDRTEQIRLVLRR